jgi:hypothetical protein
MMKTFYSLMLWLTQFEIAIAKAAPIRNADYIRALKHDEMRWEKELRLYEVNHA